MSNRKLIIYILFQLLFITNIFASEITVVNDYRKIKVASLTVHGIKYVSSKELARALNANYFFNPTHEKSEIKFKDYKLKFTAKNQFIVLTSRKSNNHQIFQLPVSSRIRGNDIYIPLKYSTKYLALAAGIKLTYLEKNDKLIVDKEEIDTKNIVKWNKKLIDRSTVRYDIYSAKIENKANGTLVRLRTKGKIKQPSSSVKDNVLYIYFSNVTIDNNQINTLKPKGLINDISIKYIRGNPQLEFKLNKGYDKHEIFYDEDIGELLISIHNKLLKKQTINLNSQGIKKWNFDVVVLDAGHGGKDPGAIGVNGIKEKNINLAIVKELGKLIEQNLKNVKVVYTRDNDKFVELYKRGKIANENNGKLFISVHCNSLRKKPSKTSGFEVYLLRPGRTKEAIAIAEFENSVINLEDDPSRYLDNENFILVSMAQASNMRYSETFADMLNTEWIKRVKIPSRGIQQAGFYVLVGASMPAVLIESGYISNKKDVKYLNSKAGQKQIAKSIFNAIVKYKKYYDNSINEL